MYQQIIELSRLLINLAVYQKSIANFKEVFLFFTFNGTYFIYKGGFGTS